MEGSHGGGPCHSVLQSTLSLHLALVGSFSFSFRLEDRGFVSDSVNKIFSPYLVTKDIKLPPELMSYPEDEHSITVVEQCLSEVCSDVDKQFPATELIIKEDTQIIHKICHSWYLKII